MHLHDAGTAAFHAPLNDNFRVTGRSDVTFRGPYQSGTSIVVHGRHARATVHGEPGLTVLVTAGSYADVRGCGATVTVDNKATAHAFDTSRLILGKDSYGYLHDLASARAQSNARVTAGDETSVDATGNANVTALGDALVKAAGDSQVHAFSYSHVHVSEGAYVTYGPDTYVTADNDVPAYSQCVALDGYFPPFDDADEGVSAWLNSHLVVPDNVDLFDDPAGLDPPVDSTALVRMVAWADNDVFDEDGAVLYAPSGVVRLYPTRRHARFDLGASRRRPNARPVDVRVAVRDLNVGPHRRTVLCTADKDHVIL